MTIVMTTSYYKKKKKKNLSLRETGRRIPLKPLMQLGLLSGSWTKHSESDMSRRLALCMLEGLILNRSTTASKAHAKHTQTFLVWTPQRAYIAAKVNWTINAKPNCE